ncbi:RHS repeat-associated core domain-containing protein [Pseudomonas sp. G2-4]|uniref:RHS repeat-associated core domain-containing protein n=1 Tax=Pseudomonas sp. G2-4 TaxID=1506334 RepID=UPI0024BA0BA3|nr:RHS repeat-associated core domain-containing protein [Pseudomonas sp. G2-4]WHS61827.1 RHS repeat-associated core domain-containing protein [Pseudomonas sp. G2-4]
MAGPDKKEQLASNESSPEADASSGEPAFSFHYDALDTLAGRSTSSGKEHRFYRHDELANEILGGVSRTFLRAEGIVLAEQQTGGEPTPRLLAGDDKNSVLVEVSQDAIKAIAYSAYGHRMDDASVRSPLGYNGERRETQTGWYLLGNGYRVFNPLLMRFHSPDSLSPFGKGGLNAYMYCVGDPINNLDPTGHTVFGFFSRGFRGLFGSNRITTATPGAQKLPRVLRLNPHEKTRPTSLLPIRPKDVNNLERRADLQLEFAAQFKGKNETKYSMYKEYYAEDSKAHAFAKEHRGEKLITKYGRQAAKRSAKRMARLENMQVEEKKAVFLDWQANSDQQMRAVQRGPGEVRSYLGVDNMERIRKERK